jgi:hypothetical protein
MGTLAADPWAGHAWVHMQLAAGLRRLGHDVHYIEATSVWPYDPVRKTKVDDSRYAAPYLGRVAESFGLGDRWAYRRSYSDKRWLGPSGPQADELLATADAVFNVAGATLPRTEEGLTVGRLVFFDTDPPYNELGFANGDRNVPRTINQHDDFVTIGENIGTAASPVPPLPRLRSRTRQPVLVELWRCGPRSRREFTTVCNWRQDGRDIEFAGERYLWSKHHEFLKFIDLPKRTGRPIELAMGLEDPGSVKPGFGDLLPAAGMTQAERRLLEVNGWKLTDAHAFSRDVWSYRDYIEASSGEFSVAKDQNVRLRTGWFSDRSACYLAAGRPVVVQDTGFGTVLPVGEGLFAFNTTDEALAAFEVIESDYGRHSRAAREIAEEYFRAEKVLAQMLDDLGL